MAKKDQPEAAKAPAAEISTTELRAALEQGQRMFARAHFASDVLAGYAVAMIVALLIEKALRRNYVASD